MAFIAPKLGVCGFESPKTGGLWHLQPQNWGSVALRAPKLEGVRGIYSPKLGVCGFESPQTGGPWHFEATNWGFVALGAQKSVLGGIWAYGAAVGGWCYGRLVPRVVVPWAIGTTAVGAVGCWCHRCWCHGLLVPWAIGTNGVGAVGRWCRGPLVL